MEEKKNTGLIWLIVILIILFGGLASLVVYKTLEKNNENITDNSTTTTITNTTITTTTKNQDKINDNGDDKKEMIKQNFLNDIKLVKKGKGTEQQKYLFCDDIYDCEKIDKFSIDSIEFYENAEDNQSVYVFKLSWSCKGDGECFYNEQYGYNDETNMNEARTFYKVDKNNRIITGLGNIYDVKFDE